MAYLVLFIALALSAVAAWYSVAGLMVLFAAAAIPVAIMASTLEVAKLVTASWLYNNWKRVPFALKSYLSFAVFVIMFVTSLGIFGFLSKAHLDQAMPAGDIATKIEIIDQKIAAQTDLITSARTVLKQLDETVSQALGRGSGNLPPNATAAQQQAATATAERNTNQAATLRRNQQKERDTQQASINKAQTEIQKLRDERAPVSAQMRTLEAEVGPIKYVAEMIWGGDAKSHFDSAVRFLIITLIFVFDPLAVLLVIAANMNLKWNREEKAKLELAKKENAEDISSTELQPNTRELEKEIVNPQITDAVTRANIGNISGKSTVETEMAPEAEVKEPAAETAPIPLVERPKEPPKEMIWPKAKIHNIKSKVEIELGKKSKTKVDNNVDKSIIDTIDGLPEDDLKEVLSNADDETLQQVYARIVEENREDDPLSRRQNAGGPPGFTPPPRDTIKKSNG